MIHKHTKSLGLREFIDTVKVAPGLILNQMKFSSPSGTNRAMVK